MFYLNMKFNNEVIVIDKLLSAHKGLKINNLRSEERRVGKEC